MGTYTDLNVSDARNSGWPKGETLTATEPP